MLNKINGKRVFRVEGKMKGVTLYADWEPKTDFKLGPKDIEGRQAYLGSKVWKNPKLEIVEYDIESLAIGIFGNQTKSVEDGIYTIYNFNNEIYKQSDIYEIKNQFTGKPLFEVRENRTTIDFTKQFNNITNI